jgi:hypothetical protein
MKSLLVQLAKVLLRLALDRAVREALPKIYEKLDISVPIAIVNGAPPAVIESEITHLAKKFTKDTVPDSTIEALALLYNPVKNAVRTQRRQR